MPAPFPPEAAAGGQVYQRKAEIIYRLYVDIARLAHSIVNVDADVDLLKVAQLVYQHAPTLDAEANDGSNAFKAAVRVRMEAGGLEWASQADMVADLVAIRAECNALRAWVIANLAEALTPAVQTFSAGGTGFVIEPTTLAKPHAVVAEIQKVRDLFA